MINQRDDLTVRVVDKSQWGTLEALFGPSGAYSGCWCMWWRVKSKDFEANGNAGNRKAMQAIVAENQIPGLLAFKDELPIGWISLGPREVYGRVERSPLLKAVDDQKVWSIVCFFIEREQRHKGVAALLLDEAARYAKKNGAHTLEGYPIDTKGLSKAQADLFTGTQEMFERAGFHEVARRRVSRPIFRKSV